MFSTFGFLRGKTKRTIANYSTVVYYGVNTWLCSFQKASRDSRYIDEWTLGDATARKNHYKPVEEPGPRCRQRYPYGGDTGSALHAYAVR